jgi:succinyl-CoA synthetase alpha subunit
LNKLVLTQLLFCTTCFAADAIMEAADAGIKVIIAITEGILQKI